jgi:hypothetical protein
MHQLKIEKCIEYNTEARKKIKELNNCSHPSSKKRVKMIEHNILTSIAEIIKAQSFVEID